MAKKEKSPEAPAAATAAESAGPPATAPAKPKRKAAKAAPADAASGPKRRGRPMRGMGKRHADNLKKVEKDRQYALEDGVKLLKKLTSDTKFVQTINVVMHLGIDPKQADQLVRGALSLPKGIGKTKKVIAFCDGDDAEAARAAGAVEVGMDELVDKISKGWMDFDVAIAHPRSMGKVGKLGRTLGPAGKMPSPKNGTVTPDVATAVREFAAGKVEFRNDAGGNVHAIVGRADFAEQDLAENIDAFIGHIRRLKPSSSKGTFIKKVCVSGTMSPAVELQVAQ